ncbi:MAG: YebC/PmpR family DNA-binding transcriptional regulator [Gammaproteobacteria bacterium]|nr:YebC/PmpR family DNA-binding transcriptional regulator [Gammaproteobacteria bacterium]
MAGHSKWANIKHRKARQDAKRAKIWTKLIRELTVAARLGGGTPEDNPRLRAAVDGALGANMPRDTIDRAIARGAGGGEEGHLDEVTYEGYGPGGVAFLVEVMTDNRNRTVAEVRHAFSKYNGNLGTDGSVAYMFERRGVLQFEPGTDEDTVMEVALEAGADDIETEDDGSITVLTSFEQFGSVLDVFRASELEPHHNEVAMVPDNSVTCDSELTEKIHTLMEALEDLDDVQNVYTNGTFVIEDS